MKRGIKVKAKKKPYAMTRAVKMEKAIMENPVEQNSKNLSTIPKSIRLRREQSTAHLEEKVQKMEEDMDGRTKGAPKVRLLAPSRLIRP